MTDLRPTKRIKSEEDLGSDGAVMQVENGSAQGVGAAGRSRRARVATKPKLYPGEESDSGQEEDLEDEEPDRPQRSKRKSRGKRSASTSPPCPQQQQNALEALAATATHAAKSPRHGTPGRAGKRRRSHTPPKPGMGSGNPMSSPALALADLASVAAVHDHSDSPSEDSGTSPVGNHSLTPGSGGPVHEISPESSQSAALLTALASPQKIGKGRLDYPSPSRHPPSAPSASASAFPPLALGKSPSYSPSKRHSGGKRRKDKKQHTETVKLLPSEYAESAESLILFEKAYDGPRFKPLNLHKNMFEAAPSQPGEEPPARMPQEVWRALELQAKHALSSKKFRFWCLCEWFYGAVDKAFFARNEFVDCLHENGFEEVLRARKLTRKEWGFVRNEVGKARRLSKAFFKEERERLRRYRMAVRSFQHGMQFLSELEPEEAPSKLPVGTRVTALHPALHELHSGVVTSNTHTVDSPDGPILYYRVKFSSAPHLGELHVPDTDLMPHSFKDAAVAAAALNQQQQAQAQSLAIHNHSLGRQANGAGGAARRVELEGEEQEAQNGGDAAFPLAESDIELISILLKLLDQKKALVDQLHEMNALVESLQQQQKARLKAEASSAPSSPTNTPNQGSGLQIPDRFREQYAWVVLHLEQTSKQLEHALLKLRIRRSGLGSARHPRPLPPPPNSPIPPRSLEIVKICRADAEVMVKQLAEGKLNPGSEILGTIEKCVAVVLLLQHVAEGEASPSVDFEKILAEIRPKTPDSIRIFEKICASVETLRRNARGVAGERSGVSSGGDESDGTTSSPKSRLCRTSAVTGGGTATATIARGRVVGSSPGSNVIIGLSPSKIARVNQ
eukprot:g70504.t1